ncbi:MAG: gcvT [Rhodospirillales bacterium]|nr:gcvT [Rhodospirillales bacterium]
MGDSFSGPLLRTPLHALHAELGAKLVPFAGYDMPVQYPAGILREHLHVREKAGLFDVSHMGQALFEGADAIAALETLVPGDVAALGDGQMRYTMLTDDKAGILDDLMVTRLSADRLFLVVNAGCKDDDYAHMQAKIGSRAKLTRREDRALLALQGPAAASVLARIVPEVAAMKFMSAIETRFEGIDALITRSGYTGEDGYEISVPNESAVLVARRLLSQPEILAIGLGARDSLRLEAGLCLYGHDIDTNTTPIEATLAWTISKRRRAEGGFPGAAIVQAQLAGGTARKRVGIKPDGRAPAREGTEIVDENGTRIGTVTSGGFGPSVEAPVAMGYVATAAAKVGTRVGLVVRGNTLPATVASMPFAPHRYFKA